MPPAKRDPAAALAPQPADTGPDAADPRRADRAVDSESDRISGGNTPVLTDRDHALRVLVMAAGVVLLTTAWFSAARDVQAYYPTPGNHPAAERSTPAAAPGVVAPRHDPARDTGYRVRINHDDADTLRLLPGVGPAIAQNLIDHRQTHGPFTHPRQLEDVHRIGPSVRERITPWLRFD